MQRVRKTIDGISTANRSKVSNGTKLLRGVDGRSPEARRFRDLIRGYTAEFEVTTDFDKIMVRTAATLTYERDEMMAAKMRGERVNNDDVVRTASELRRVLSELKHRSNGNAPAAPLSFAEQLSNHDNHDDNEGGA